MERSLWQQLKREAGGLEKVSRKGAFEEFLRVQVTGWLLKMREKGTEKVTPGVWCESLSAEDAVH